LLRCVTPLRFTHSYSERYVSRRVFGNDNELTLIVAMPNARSCSCHHIVLRSGCTTPRTQEVFHRKTGGRLLKRKRSWQTIAQATGRATRPVSPLYQPAIR
jgi:hypothetical protein